jgi:MFS family permease
MVIMFFAHALSRPEVRKDWKIIGLVGIGHAGSHFSHLLLPLMFPIFSQVFGLGYAQLGLSVSVFFVVSGIGQALSGFLVDRLGAMPVLLAALGCLVFGCLLASQVNGLGGLVLTAVFLGLGNCAFHPIDFSILNHHVSNERMGYAYSTHGLAGNLGWAVAPVFMLTATHLVGWRWAYGLAALVFLALLLLIAQYRHELAVQPAKSTRSKASPPLSFLRETVIWWCFAFFMFSTMTLAVVQSFSVSIMQHMHQVSLLDANSALTGYMLFAALGMLLGGVVASRWPDFSDRVVAVCMAAGAVLIFLSGTGVMGAFGSMAILALTGLAIGIGGPSRDLLIRQSTPKGATGRVYGTVYSGLDVGFAIAPLVFGLLMDRAWYGQTLMLAALTLLISIGFALGVGQRVRLSSP